MGLKNTIMHKVIKGKRKPLCDYEGKCKNLAYKEVYPLLLEKKHEDKGWSYLCKKHFKQELKRLKRKLVYCAVD